MGEYSATAQFSLASLLLLLLLLLLLMLLLLLTRDDDDRQTIIAQPAWAEQRRAREVVGSNTTAQFPLE
jgi:hypothetical protein